MDYNKIYQQDNVWGEEPNPLLKIIWDRAAKNAHFLDLGCGQGRDALFMWKQDFEVTAVDNSTTGIQQIREKTKDSPKMQLVFEDLKTFDIGKNKYGIINLFNSLQFLEKKDGLTIIKKTKENLLKNGYIIISGFTFQDDLYAHPKNKTKCFFDTQELKELFADFKIFLYKEIETNDHGHSGNSLPHKHSLVQLIAQK